MVTTIKHNIDRYFSAPVPAPEVHTSVCLCALVVSEFTRRPRDLRRFDDQMRGIISPMIQPPSIHAACAATFRMPAVGDSQCGSTRTPNGYPQRHFSLVPNYPVPSARCTKTGYLDTVSSLFFRIPSDGRKSASSGPCLRTWSSAARRLLTLVTTGERRVGVQCRLNSAMR
ncbi:hypothetical protein P154DRAFT_356894 [Amniculicola lignicola CBS 123094]|uniref:Uncharacterized protein n=1 Tax=Amniculicola lignicola CBS 123094 TaxID=1392246 RepID=A0A6A5X185_9PLEO|nr:hypothetical protein P154DRAFT_356894 [Amniculicola lignicola CBS 123094]